jgi:hypothetical protein
MDLLLQLLAFVGVPAGLYALTLVLRSRERMRLLDIVRSTTEQGHPLPPELVDALRHGRALASPDRDYRRGLQLVAMASAIALIGFCGYVFTSSVDEENAVAVGIGIAALAAIPGCIGIALIVLSRASRKTRND